MNLTKLFEPKSIALIGASNTQNKLGNYLATNLIESNYGGNLFFLNPKKENILSISSLQNPLEIKESIDLWIVVIPADLVIGIVKQIALQKQNFSTNEETFLIVISAGFKETGSEGELLEAELVELCKEIASKGDIK